MVARGPTRQPGLEARPWPREGPGSRLAPVGAAPAPAARRAVYALPPPTEAPAPGTAYIRAQGRNAAQTLADGEVVLGTLQLSTGQVGVIRIVEFDINNLLGTSDIRFRIRVDGAVPRGWEWTPFATAAALFAKEFPPESTYIRLPENAQVEVTGEVLDAGTYDLGADIQGWQYGSELRDGYQEAWAAVLF